VAHELLDGREIGAMAQQEGGKGVTHRVQGHPRTVNARAAPRTME
jgi:hypothetical protein